MVGSRGESLTHHTIQMNFKALVSVTLATVSSAPLLLIGAPSAQAFSGSNSLFVDRSSTASPAPWNGVRFYLSGSNATDTLEVGASYEFSSKVYLTDSSANLALKLKN